MYDSLGYCLKGEKMRAYRLDQGSEGKQVRLGLRRPGKVKEFSLSHRSTVRYLARAGSSSCGAQA